jgi:hypothetical protein
MESQNITEWNLKILPNGISKYYRMESRNITEWKLIVICGLSNAAYQRDDGVYVISITMLKN